jgi:RimJ/RimL family protein N-acetyltransferase
VIVSATVPAVAEYPREEEVVVLRDGTTVRLRPIRPDDAPKLMELYQHLSEESLYYRFFTVPKADPRAADYLSRVDYDGQFGLVAELDGRVVAVARYYRDDAAPTRAEAAFTVADELHGHGLGTRLIERSADIAGARGIRTFEADVLHGNDRMADVFISSGFREAHALEDGVIRFELALAPSAVLE